MTTARTLALLAGLVAPLGCAITIGQSGSWGGGSAGCNAEHAGGRVDYHVTHMRHGDTVYLILVADGAAGGGCSGGPPPHGHFDTLDGRRVEWECDTRDGASGKVTIGGATYYDLPSGRLFLISARHGKTHVRQVAADLSQLKGPVDLESLKAATQADPSVTEFLEMCGPPKPTPRDPK
jgi:hypothetical protein